MYKNSKKNSKLKIFKELAATGRKNAASHPWSGKAQYSAWAQEKQRGSREGALNFPYDEWVSAVDKWPPNEAAKRFGL